MSKDDINIFFGQQKIAQSDTNDTRPVAVVPAGTVEITARETSESPTNWCWLWNRQAAGWSKQRYGTSPYGGNSCNVIEGNLSPTFSGPGSSSTTSAIIPGSNNPNAQPSCIVSTYFYYDYDNGHRHVGVLYGDQATANSISGATCGASGAQIGTPGGNAAIRLNGEMKLSVCSLPVADKQISFATGIGISADGRRSGNVAKGINAKAVRQLFRYSTSTSKTAHDAIRDEVHILTEGEKSIAFWKEPASSTWQAGPDGLTELETLYSGDTITGFREKVKGSSSYTAWEYTANGYLVSTTTANDNVTYYENDVNGKVTKITTNADDNVIYGRTSGDVTYIQFDPAGTSERRTQYFTYDGNARISSHKSYAGCTTNYTWNVDGKLASETDGEGYVTYFTYDAAEAAARPSKIVYPDGSFIYFEYDPFVTGTKDASGNSAYYRYDIFGNPVAIKDALGNTTYFEYNDSGLKTSEKTPRGYSTTYENDTYGNVTSVTNPLSATTYYEYARTDYGSRLTKQIDALGHETYYGYDAKGNRTSATDALGASSYLAYDATGMMTAQKDALENATYFTYNTRGLTTAVKNALGNATYFEYNPFGDRTAVKDARGNSTYYEVDAMGRITRTTDAFGNFTQTGYDGRGLVTTQVDQLNHASYMEYDGASRLKKSINAIGNETYYRYDLRGNQTSITDARDNSTYMAYDAVNRLRCTIDPLSNKTYFTYDADGNQTAVKNPLGRTMYMYYDSLGRNKGTIDALGNESYYEFDAVGNTTAAVNQLGNATYYYFDALNRQKGIVDALGNETYLVFDAAGNRTASIDARTNATYFYYDALNRQKGTIDTLGHESYFVFDSVGNSTASVNQLGRASYYYYDALNRQKGQVDALGNETYLVFDAAGNRTASIDARTNATYFYYDALNRQKGTVDTLGNESYIVYDAAGNTVATVNALTNATYFYYDALNRQKGNIDALGNETYLVFDAAGNTAATVDQLGNASYFVYDVLNRQTCLIDALENKTYYEYDAAGNRTAVTDQNNYSTYYTYDAAGRNTCVIDALENNTYFAYDPNGNRTATVDPLGHASYWYYDARNMLKGTFDALGHENYFVYDAAGNRTAEVDPLNRAAYYEFDALGRLSATKNPLNQAAYYEYDENGNTVAHKAIDGVATYYTFDELNRQTAIAPTNDAASYFAYDAASNRSWMRRGNEETYFTYDPLNRLSTEEGCEFNVYHEYDAAGRRNAVSTSLTGLEPQPQVSYYEYDELGRMTVAGSPTIGVAYYLYDAAGNITQKKVMERDYMGVLAVNYTAYMEYDSLNRQTRLHNVLGNDTTLTKYVNTFDASGRLEKTLREDDDAIYYEYDAVGRTTRETWKASDHSTIYAFAWDYDEVGNRTYEYLNTTGTATETYYTFNGLNRPLHKHNWPADTYTYYEYDSRNNITQVDEPAESTYFYYDDHNKLIKTTYKSPYAGRYMTEYFGYDASGRRNFHLPWAYNEVYFTYDQNGEMLSKRMSSQNMARLNGQSVVAMFDWTPYFVVYDTLRRFAGVVRQGAYPYPSDIVRYCFNSAGRLFTYYFPYSIEMNTAVFPDSLYFVWGKLSDTGEVVLTDGTPGQGGEYPPMPPNSGHAGQCPETVLCCEALAPERPMIETPLMDRFNQYRSKDSNPSFKNAGPIPPEYGYNDFVQDSIEAGQNAKDFWEWTPPDPVPPVSLGDAIQFAYENFDRLKQMYSFLKKNPEMLKGATTTATANAIFIKNYIAQKAVATKATFLKTGSAASPAVFESAGAIGVFAVFGYLMYDLLHSAAKTTIVFEHNKKIREEAERQEIENRKLRGNQYPLSCSYQIADARLQPEKPIAEQVAMEKFILSLPPAIDSYQKRERIDNLLWFEKNGYIRKGFAQKMLLKWAK